MVAEILCVIACQCMEMVSVVERFGKLQQEIIADAEVGIEVLRQLVDCTMNIVVIISDRLVHLMRLTRIGFIRSHHLETEFWQDVVFQRANELEVITNLVCRRITI